LTMLTTSPSTSTEFLCQRNFFWNCHQSFDHCPLLIISTIIADADLQILHLGLSATSSVRTKCNGDQSYSKCLREDLINCELRIQSAITYGIYRPKAQTCSLRNCPISARKCGWKLLIISTFEVSVTRKTIILFK
ncbi:hypothetical protein PMAYCL1PPCAC_20950, partial [Pristionchus mayeri]